MLRDRPLTRGSDLRVRDVDLCHESGITLSPAACQLTVAESSKALAD